MKTGKVRVVYKQLAQIGDESRWAANASLCAADQGKFWEYAEKVFREQRGENKGAYAKNNLKRFAQEIGLDSAAFNSCVDQDKFMQRVNDELTDARKNNVRATPSFLLNGQLIEGALPFSEFKKRIDAELAKKQ